MIVINNVLAIYRENGTHEFPIKMTRSRKLSIVGFTTKNLGGKMKSSSKGLNALLIVYTSGSDMNAPNTPRNRNNKKLTANERFNRLRTRKTDNALDANVNHLSFSRVSA